MGTYNGWRGLVRVAGGSALAGLLAACNYGPSQPAPVYYESQGHYGSPGYSGGQGGAPGWSLPSGAPPPLAMAPRPGALPPVSGGPLPAPASGSIEVTVQRGDQLGHIAERYHVSQRTIIEANRLRPPYRLVAGTRLVIPGTVTGGVVPPDVAPRQGPSATASAGGPQVIPLDTNGAPHPPESLVGPRPPVQAGPVPGGGLTPPGGAPPAALRPPSGEPSAAEEAQAEGSRPRPEAPAGEPRTHAGRFPWPVQGRIVAGYGPGPGGARNDGINIAAPRGTPIRAIEGGEVAYAGNELRGYGNLILVKHDDGWISAYAHCEELLVKKGDRVRPGQVIAKVGATGSVHEPQLHFELRRGKRPVDPREFLAPAPSAGAASPAG